MTDNKVALAPNYDKIKDLMWHKDALKEPMNRGPNLPLV